MYEIIAEPQDYGIDALVEGLGNNPVYVAEDERQKWADEIGEFVERIEGLAQKSRQLQDLLTGGDKIKATPVALKTLKIQLFKINNALNNALDLAGRIEGEFIEK